MSTDITTRVVELIAGDNPSAANRFAKQFKSKNHSSEKETIRELNRYWRDQLLTLHSSTISARSCLDDEMTGQEWLRHFSRLVLPVIISNDLPVGC
jgi:hypothetical protein